MNEDVFDYLHTRNVEVIGGFGTKISTIQFRSVKTKTGNIIYVAFKKHYPKE